VLPRPFRRGNAYDQNYFFYMTFEGLHFNEIWCNIGKGTLDGNFDDTTMEWRLHVKQAVQRGIWVPTQHPLWDRGKPRKAWSSWPVAGPSGYKLTSTQLFGIKYANPNVSPDLCCCFIFYFFDSIYLYNRSILRTISTSFEILNLMKT
jgi:hypothetical protein